VAVTEKRTKADIDGLVKSLTNAAARQLAAQVS
jgi:hypothetical protein